MNKFIIKSLFLTGICLLTHTINASSASTATHSSTVGIGSSQITEEYQYIIAASGQDLTTSGVYLFSETIEYTTASSGPAAICISTDNVTIDLNGQMLLCEEGVGATVHGIQIKAGLKNITIKDGTIVCFPGNAVDMPGTSVEPIKNVKFENMRIISNQGGIVGEFIYNAKIDDVNVHDTAKDDHVYGFYFKNSDSVHINNSIANRGVTSTINKKTYGVYYEHCVASSVEDTICNNNKGYLESTGIYLTDNTDTHIDSNYITRCTCNNNIASNGDAHGVYLDQADLVYVDECVFRNNRAYPLATVAFRSYGLRLKNAQNITTTGNLATRNNYGFWDDQPLFEQSNLFINNTALWNVAKEDGNEFDGSEGTKKGDFIRTVSTPIDFTEASVDHLQDMLAIAPGYSNKSIVIKLDTNA
jgi:hypothetical protein